MLYALSSPYTAQKAHEYNIRHTHAYIILLSTINIHYNPVLLFPGSAGSEFISMFFSLSFLSSNVSS